MRTDITIGETTFEVVLQQPLDISIPLLFDGAQPNTYDFPVASAHSVEAGSFVGDTRRGGSCNVEEYRLIPHCNGTHTEGVGHIAVERIAVRSILQEALVPATLISITATPVEMTDETTKPAHRPGDKVLTRAALQEACAAIDSDFAAGLVVRTLPNSASKKSMRYGDPPPPYFTSAAVAYINELGVRHFLMDIPSVDRTVDEGLMTGHHLYWNVAEGRHDVDPQRHSLKTITEMIFVPDDVPDGRYCLNLQIPSFVSDAAPSRPLLFRIRQTANT